MPIAAIIAIVVVALIVVAGGVTWMLGYPMTGFEPLRAAATEAGERASDLTSDFFDWVKRGG